MKKFNQNEQGRSMIEMLGVLAIVGVLSVAGIAGYSKGMAKYKSNQLMDQVSTISANVKTLFANGTPIDATLTNAIAIKLKVYPDAMTKSGSAKNAFNGATTVVGNADGTFTITLEGIPQEACAAMGLGDWGDASGFVSIKGSADGSKDIAGLTNASTNCAATNKIIMVYK